jgi:hypothetical protein
MTIQDDRPLRKAKRRPQPKKSGGLVIWLLLGGAAVCFCLAGVPVIAVLVWLGVSKSTITNDNVNKLTNDVTGKMVPGPSDSRVAEENFNKLKNDMTESEIVAILGTPMKTEDRDPPPQIAAQFEPGKIRVLLWAQREILIDLTLTPGGRARFATGLFPDGNGGMKELHGTSSGQLSNLASHGGSGPSKVTSAKAWAIPNGQTQDAVVLGLGEQPTKKLGPQKMANGQMSSETWEWKNGKGYLRVHFNETKNVIGKEEKDLPAY